MTEIHIDNADHSLLPGMYAEVKLTRSDVREAPWIRVPGTTIVTNNLTANSSSPSSTAKLIIRRSPSGLVTSATKSKSEPARRRTSRRCPSDDLREGDQVDAHPATGEQ